MSIAEARARWPEKFRERVHAVATLLERTTVDETPTPCAIEDESFVMEIDQDALDAMDEAERKSRERYDAEVGRERREEWYVALDRDEP